MKIDKKAEILIYIVSAIISFNGAIQDSISVTMLRIIVCIGILSVSVCFVLLYLLKNYKEKVRKNSKKLAKEISKLDSDNPEEKNEKQYKLKELLKEKNNLKDINKKYKEIREVIKLVVIIVLIFYIPRSNPIISFAKEAFEIIMEPLTNPPEIEEQEETLHEEPEIEEQEETLHKEPEIEEQEETLHEEPEIEDWAKFTLEYPDGYPEIDDKEFNDLYNSIFYVNEVDVNKEVENRIMMLIDKNKINMPLNEVTTKFGKDPKYYSDIEAEFSYGGTNNTSSKWDEIIEGRKELLDLCPNGTFAWLLANNYQTYALNYLEQTNESNSILYLYMKSIDYAQKSLEYDTDIETKHKRLNYIKARYKDIGDCEILGDDIRLKAYQIYNAINDILNDLDMESYQME